MKVQFAPLKRRPLFREAASDKPAPSPKAKTVQKLREVISPSRVELDCSNPDCPYRAAVMAQREGNRKRVKSWRAKK